MFFFLKILILEGILDFEFSFLHIDDIAPKWLTSNSLLRSQLYVLSAIPVNDLSLFDLRPKLHVHTTSHSFLSI